VAPRPYASSGPGTDCRDNGRTELLFRVYYDGSASDATTLFARLKVFFGSGTPASGIGDEAYFDKSDALHARKGNVRFYLEAGKGNEAARIEVVTPIFAAGPRQRLWEILDICLRDQREAWVLGAGCWVRKGSMTNFARHRDRLALKPTERTRP
jgi:hypothetical protein